MDRYDEDINCLRALDLCNQKIRPNGYNGTTLNLFFGARGGVELKRGTRFFYFMGGLILVLSVWLGIETPWSRLSDEIAFSVLLNLIIGLSLGVTEIAVGWLVGLHLEDEQK